MSFRFPPGRPLLFLIEAFPWFRFSSIKLFSTICFCGFPLAPPTAPNCTRLSVWDFQIFCLYKPQIHPVNKSSNLNFVLQFYSHHQLARSSVLRRVQTKPVHSKTASLWSSPVWPSCWTRLDRALPQTGIVCTGGIIQCNYGKILLTNSKTKSLIWIYGWTRWATCWQPAQFSKFGSLPSNHTRLDSWRLLTTMTANWATVWFGPGPGPEVTVPTRLNESGVESEPEPNWCNGFTPWKTWTIAFGAVSTSKPGLCKPRYFAPITYLSLIVSRHDLYVDHAVLAARSPCAIQLAIRPIFIEMLSNTCQFRITFALISQPLNKYLSDRESESGRWKSG